MKAIVFDRFGEPADVLTVRDVPIPEPGPGQVRIRMIASPINPSDLLVTRGRYGVLPTLPATPGFEGVGIVEKLGPGLNPLGRLVLGKRVAVINGDGGNWAEYVVIPSRQARPVPADLSDDDAATIFVNPATVLAMVRHTLRVPRGSWVLQSAAGSELGRMIIRLARHDGFRTLNVVRRPEARDELLALGADRVICSSDGPIDQQVHAFLGSEPVRYALDPVGGETGSQLFRALAPDGRLLVYGSLSNQPLQIESRALIAGNRVLQGFWLGHWMRSRNIPQSLSLFAEIARLIRAGILRTRVGSRFPLDRIAEAARLAETSGRPGKVLLTMNPSPHVNPSPTSPIF
jgi:NADPH:quinone reductase-like Zn-dependent oxidoreductase